MNFKTKAFLIKTQKFSEADKLITAIDFSGKKIKFIGKGASKVLAKMSGYLNIFNYLDLVIAEGKNLDIVTSAEIIVGFKNVETNLTKTGVAFLIAEVIDKLLLEEENHYGLLNLILYSFDWIDNSEQKFIKRIISFFLICFIEKIGFIPELHHCVDCRKKSESEIHLFDYQKGGLICNNCFEKGFSQEVTINEIKLLRIYLEVGKKIPNNFFLQIKSKKPSFHIQSRLAILKKIDDNLDNKITNLLFRYLDFISDKRFLSKSFLKKIERL